MTNSNMVNVLTIGACLFEQNGLLYDDDSRCELVNDGL